MSSLPGPQCACALFSDLGRGFGASPGAARGPRPCCLCLPGVPLPAARGSAAHAQHAGVGAGEAVRH